MGPCRTHSSGPRLHPQTFLHGSVLTALLAFKSVRTFCLVSEGQVSPFQECHFGEDTQRLQLPSDLSRSPPLGNEPLWAPTCGLDHCRWRSPSGPLASSLQHLVFMHPQEQVLTFGDKHLLAPSLNAHLHLCPESPAFCPVSPV